MDPFAPKTLVIATTAATLLAWRARRRKSLTRAGAAMGFVAGFLLVATGLRGFVLFGFYQLGSMATRYKAAYKATVDATAAHASERGATQVLCVSIVATILSLQHAWYHGAEQAIDFTMAPGASRLTTAILAHHAVSLADTLASELGMLASASASTSRNNGQRRHSLPHHYGLPRLVTQPWRTVPVGTNGGVTLVGTLWSIVGGLLVGALTVAMDFISGIAPLQFVPVTLYGGLCGLVGSLLDSILGATLQATYYDDDNKLVHHHFDSNARRHHNNNQPPASVKHVCGMALLTNAQVNLVSVTLTAGLGGWVMAPWFFGLWQTAGEP